VSEPIEGTTVDSSPVDHRTRKSDPVTPVTTPSRGASPTFLEGICTRSPTTAISEWCHCEACLVSAVPHLSSADAFGDCSTCRA
jgi:hypothetical protein